MHVARRSNLATVNTEPKRTSAERLNALRLELGFRTLKELSDATAEHGERIPEGSLRGYETRVRGVPKDEDKRRALSAALGLTLEAFGAYIRGDVDLDATVRASTLRKSLPPQSETREPTGTLLRHHAEWADIGVRAVKVDNKIEPGDVREIGLKPAMFDRIDDVSVDEMVELVVRLARIHRRLRGRP